MNALLEDEFDQELEAAEKQGEENILSVFEKTHLLDRSYKIYQKKKNKETLTEAEWIIFQLLHGLGFKPYGKVGEIIKLNWNEAIEKYRFIETSPFEGDNDIKTYIIEKHGWTRNGQVFFKEGIVEIPS